MLAKKEVTCTCIYGYDDSGETAVGESFVSEVKTKWKQWNTKRENTK